MNRTAITPVLIALLVVAGMTVPAAAFASNASPRPATGSAGPLPAVAAQANDTQNESNVSVAVGQQLATVISVSSDEVRTEYGNTAFELSVEGADDEAAAEAVADRADELRERARAIREDYEAATRAYEDGELTKSEYAQRLASLNARASNLVASYEQLTRRAENVSSLELRAAGANLSSLDASLENLSGVTGAGSSALLEQYLGEADGEIELETAGGLKIEVEREDGESSREFERARDDDMNVTVAHSDALATARDALSTPEEGRWALAESKVKPLEGAYEFEFDLAEAATLTGEARVRVDGSTGEIYRLEQETERRDDDGADGDDEHDELTLLVAEGTPEPGATVTIQVLADGEPAAGVAVAVDDHAVGTTDEHGTLAVTLPDGAEAELAAEAGDAEGELEFEFDDEHEADRVYHRLHVAASLDGDDVTVEVRFDGEPVRNATVYADDDRVGRTDTHGTVTFAIDASASEELELEVVKGAFEAELAYALHGGSLVLTEAEHEGDGDKAERDDEDDDRDERPDDGEHDDDADDADDDQDDEADDGDRSLAMSVVGGTAEPGATVTVEVRADGAPVEGATVTVNGELAGTTDANGTVEVALPMEDSIDLRAEHGDADTRLEFDFEFDGSDETGTETEEA